MRGVLVVEFQILRPSQGWAVVPQPVVVGEVKFYGTEEVAILVEHSRLEGVCRQRFGADPAVVAIACVFLGGNLVQVV